MEFSGDKVIEVPAAGCKRKCKSVDEGIGRAWCFRDTALTLSDDEGKGEEELVIVVQTEEERRWRC